MFRKIAIMCMAVLWKETRTQVSILVVSRSTCGSSGHMCAVVGVGGADLCFPRIHVRTVGVYRDGDFLLS